MSPWSASFHTREFLRARCPPPRPWSASRDRCLPRSPLFPTLSFLNCMTVSPDLEVGFPRRTLFSLAGSGRVDPSFFPALAHLLASRRCFSRSSGRRDMMTVLASLFSFFGLYTSPTVGPCNLLDSSFVVFKAAFPSSLSSEFFSSRFCDFSPPAPDSRRLSDRGRAVAHETLTVL